ncbi:Verru_Chthon cassette protein B [Verrucomicrobium sp. GAS474]|uniref:type IV pilus modification PilV family protein n=1 Tax=Verrucomicrobium sp. GAS474 TaxID=1882831 RepID=UPI00087D4B61|nr:hypothetical protein [Verrucomicrobium sp. GAS474]SDU05417.1 Verru_Chthon cassette protein B [Verrucomicrobium sp. GAS474]
MKTHSFHRIGTRAFSLIEVAFSLGICSFALIAMFGLFGTGLQSSRDSEDQIQAANLASLIVSTRMASPTGTIANFVLPANAISRPYGDLYTEGTYIGVDGKLTSLANAAYQVTCRTGTNAATGSSLSQIYLMLSWPPQAALTSAMVKHYELLVYVPIR